MNWLIYWPKPVLGENESRRMERSGVKPASILESPTRVERISCPLSVAVSSENFFIAVLRAKKF
jgi:hypothetical protein